MFKLLTITLQCNMLEASAHSLQAPTAEFLNGHELGWNYGYYSHDPSTSPSTQYEDTLVNEKLAALEARLEAVEDNASLGLAEYNFFLIG